MKIALVDYQDSFTYNIFHYLEGMGEEVVVFSDKTLLLADLNVFDAIILSPGPGLPDETASMFAILKNYSSSKKILGICLGMQGIVSYFGGTLYNQEKVQHGVQVPLKCINQNSLLRGLPLEFKVGLYHSWACEITNCPDLFSLAESNEGVLMAVQHNTLPIFGLQFHPESVMTEHGRTILENFINFRH